VFSIGYYTQVDLGFTPHVAQTFTAASSARCCPLENEGASTRFAAGSAAPYLSHTLRSQGGLCPDLYAIGHQSNDNYIAMISGQAPNIETQSDCQFFSDFVFGGVGAYGQMRGEGCLYPTAVPTIASQFDRAGLEWRDYSEGMGSDPARESSVCGHPAPGGSDVFACAPATRPVASGGRLPASSEFQRARLRRQGLAPGWSCTPWATHAPGGRGQPQRGPTVLRRALVLLTVRRRRIA